jgi:hypothetical protein
VTVSKLNRAALDVRAKMMILECNLFRARSKLLQRCFCNAQSIILMHFAYKCRGLHVHREDLVNFFKKSELRNDIAKQLRQRNVLSLSGTESNLCLKTANPEDWAICIHQNVTGARKDVLLIVSVSLQPAACEVCIEVAL